MAYNFLYESAPHEKANDESRYLQYHHNDFELLTLAAQQKEVSRSDFLRMALREKASRVLAGLEDHLSSETGAVLGLRGTAKKS